MIDWVALGVTWAMMIWFAGRANLSRGLSFLAGAVGMVAALWGGRLYVLLQNGPAAVVRDPAVLLQVLPGGKAVMGALFGAIVAAYLLLLIRRQPFLRYADAWVPAVALGYVVARIGCFINGDDFGVVSTLPWAVQFPTGTEAYTTHLARGWIAFGSSLSLPVHPTELYHALTGLGGFVVLLTRRPRWTGERLALALAWFGIARLLIEFLRDVHWRHGLFFDTTQWICLLLIALALGLWWFRRADKPSIAMQTRVTEAGL